MYTPEEIDYEIDSVNLIPEYARASLATALSHLPQKIIDFVIENCVFISLDKKCGGMFVVTNDFRLEKKRGIIFLPEKLWSKSEKAITFTVAHEVAHAYYKHGLKHFEDTDPVINKKREKDADKQAVEWLHSHFSGSFKRYTYKDWQLS